MRTLLVLRHAKAEHDSPDGSDFARPLSERGYRDALLVAKAIRKLEVIPDLILVSPATRTRETVDALVQKWKIDVPTVVDDSIYESSVSNLLNVLDHHHHSAETVLLVGHNPGVEGLVGRLLFPEAPPPLHLPTAGLARLDLHSDWQDLARNRAELVWLCTPDFLRSLD